MKISLQWLNDFIDIIKYPVSCISDKLTSCGLEVGNVDTYESIPGSFEGLVVGEVVDCKQHPNADLLRCLKVDIGDKVLNIVCGAPNARKGIKVVVAQVNTMIYPFEGDPIVIKKSKIRGEFSEGMLCAEDEVGIGKNHNMIIEVNNSYVNGTPVNEVYNVKKQQILDVELTPNRGDSCSHLGIARSLKALFNEEIKNQSTLQLDKNEMSSYVINSAHNGCKRYDCIVVKNVKISESPKYVKERLLAVGVRPINNVVDITNYVMLELGQPMHAYDFGRINGNLHVRLANNNESIKALNGSEYQLASTDLVIADDMRALGIAGIIGGQYSSIQNDTVDILFEAAYFDPIVVRKCASRLHIKTDASYRFERGCDIDMPLKALQRACWLLKEQCPEAIVDKYHEYFNGQKPDVVNLSLRWFNSIVGQEISHDKIFEILKKLDFKIFVVDSDNVSITVPLYKTNIKRDVDIVDEFMRFYGYENIKTTETLVHNIDTVNSNLDISSEYRIRERICNYLSSNGFYEISTNSLISSKNVDGQCNIKISNPLSNEHDTLRPDLIYSGMRVIRDNINNGNKNLKLFELGKHYHKVDQRCGESLFLGIFVTGETDESWMLKKRQLSFFDLKSIVVSLLKTFGVYDYSETITQNNQYFSQCLSIDIKEDSIAKCGIVSSSMREKFSVEQEVFYASIDIDVFFKHIRNKKTKDYEPVSQYPSVKRDLSIIVDKSTTFYDINDIILKTNKLIKNVNVFDVYVGDQIPDGKKSYAISIIFQDNDGTLESNKVHKITKKIVDNLFNRFGATIR